MTRDLKRFLDEHYVAPQFIVRDTELERWLIRRSKVEMILLAQLAVKNLDAWNGKLTITTDLSEYKCELQLNTHYTCPDTEKFSIDNDKYGCCTDSKGIQSRCYFLDTVRFMNCVVRVPRRWASPPDSPRRRFASIYVEINSFNSGTEKSYDHAIEVDGGFCEPRYPDLLEFFEDVLGEETEVFNLGKVTRVVKLGKKTIKHESDNEECKTKLRKKDCLARARKKFSDSFSTLVPLAHGLCVNAPLTQVFALLQNSEKASEKDAVTELANRFKVGIHPHGRQGWVNRCRGWEQFPDIRPFEDAISSDQQGGGPGDDYAFCSNAEGFSTEAILLNRRYGLILPVTAWTRQKVSTRYYFNIPPKRPQLMNLARIRSNRDAVVMLTDSVEVAFAQQPTTFDGRPVIWSSWYGEDETALSVPWDGFKGRTVVYVITERPGVSKAQAFRTASVVCEKLRHVWGVKLYVADDLSTQSRKVGSEAQFRVLPDEQFAEEAEALMGVVSRQDCTPAFRPTSMRELMNTPQAPREYLLAPAFTSPSTSLIYAPTNVGKTWAAMCIATAVAHGVQVFGRWRAPEPRRVLYIDSEMDKAAMQERIRTVGRMRFDGRKLPVRHRGNLNCVSRSRSQGDVEEFKRHVRDYVKAKGVALVVLDNLTAFTQHNDSAKAWEDVHTWIDSLKEFGCSVILVHHANKMGDQRGTSAVTNAVDNVIRLTDLKTAVHEHKEETEKAKRFGFSLPGPCDEFDSFDEGFTYPGLRLIAAFEKGRNIHGDARSDIYFSICPSTSPPMCAAYTKNSPGGGGAASSTMDEVATTESNTADQTSKLLGGKGNRNQETTVSLIENRTPGEPSSVTERKRIRRTRAETEKLAEELMTELQSNGASKMKDLAAECGVSVGWAYRLLDEFYGKNWKKFRPKRSDALEERNARILEMRDQGVTESAMAKKANVSKATVRRIIDEDLVRQIRKGRLRNVKRIAEKFGLSSAHAERLLGRARAERVHELYKNEKQPSTLAEKANMGVDEVKRIIAPLEEREARRDERRMALLKIKELLEEQRSQESIDDETIVQFLQGELPRKTVLTELRDLRIIRLLDAGDNSAQIMEKLTIGEKAMQSALEKLEKQGRLSRSSRDS